VTPPKTLIGASVSLLALSAVLGVLNTQRTRELRAQVTQAEVARNAAEELRITREKELKGREAVVAAANAKFGETRTKIESTEAELIKAQKEKNDLQAKLRENETEIAQLLKRIEEPRGSRQLVPILRPLKQLTCKPNWKTRRSNWMPRNARKLCSLTRSGPPRSDQPNWKQKRKGGSRLEGILEFAARCWQPTKPTIL
jgi:septal ring factor EnvC (AmiA/AmiB activator)